MSKAQTTKTKRRFRLFASIRAKMAMILLTMGATSAAVGFMVFLVFERISTQMDQLAADQLPRMQVSTQVAAEATKTKDGMIQLLKVNDNFALPKARETVEETIARLKSHVANLDEAVRPEFEAGVEAAQVALEDLAAARGTLLRSEDAIAILISDLQVTSEYLQSKMKTMAEEAYAKLVEGGDATVQTIDESMSRLIDEDFALMQNLLESRAEVNLLSGTAIALGLTKDPEMSATLAKIAEHSQWKLDALVRRMEDTGQVILDTSVLRTSAEVLKSVVQQSLFPSESLRRAAIEARNEADTLISDAIDSMGLELMIGAQMVNSTNRREIRDLLEGEVMFLNTLLEVNGAISQFQVGALGVATATSMDEVEIASELLNKASESLAGYSKFGGGALFSAIGQISRLTDETSGLVALKHNTLRSQEVAIYAADETERAVLSISQLAADLGAAVQGEIENMALSISADVLEAERNMLGLMVGAAGVFVVAMFLTQLWISRPMSRISVATANLADGDRSPITGFERASTEIASIARSLSVFRDGLVEKEEMTRLAEEERRARQEAQDAAVVALGAGLSSLSHGDLTTRIEQPLTEGYEQLRKDFNSTLDNLNATMVQVVEASSSMQGGASEISQASDDLSRRTESQAATLEETAAALDELTASVKSAAEGARGVERTVGEARTEAEESGVVVQNAVTAMTEIEQSSNHISQIIAVIDDIAFQTNLLALNAGVEAARAGEAGRGFAVVASEVRALAQRSSDAAMEIKTLISSSSKQVESGVDLVGKAGEALQSIMGRVNHIAELVSDIANGAEEQSTGLYEINTGMSQLDQVTQQNAAMVEESTAAGHLLSSDASKLSELVSQFQTDEGRAHVVSVDNAAPSAHGDSAFGDGFEDGFDSGFADDVDQDFGFEPQTVNS